MGASAAPCSADFDPRRRTAPAGRGPRVALRPRAFPTRGWGSRRPPLRVTRGGGGQSPVRVLFPCPSVGGVRVFVGAIGVERSLHRGGAGGGALGGRRRHEHRKEAGSIRGGAGRRGPLRRPAVERARKLLSAARWTNFLQVLGLPFLLPSRPAVPSRGGGAVSSRGWGPSVPPPPSLWPGPPRPLPARGLLGNCDLHGC